jgi:hypothetical protein
MGARPAIRALLWTLLSDLLSFFASSFRSRAALQAENLFLRKELAFYGVVVGQIVFLCQGWKFKQFDRSLVRSLNRKRLQSCQESLNLVERNSLAGLPSGGLCRLHRTTAWEPSCGCAKGWRGC